MSFVKRKIKALLRSLGYECTHYDLNRSADVRLIKMLKTNGIKVVIDVGANVGQYGQLLREAGYLGRIISFEPLTDAHAKLSVVAAEDPRWTIYARSAIGDIDGSIKINISANSQSSSVLGMKEAHVKAAPSSSYVSTEVVPIIRLDSIENELLAFGSEGIFLKADVQGFERQVLAGAAGMMRYIKGVQLELSLLPLSAAVKVVVA